MLVNLVEGFICGAIVIVEMLVAIIGALLIQGIVYQVTGFSIYNWFCKLLFAEVMNNNYHRK